MASLKNLLIVSAAIALGASFAAPSRAQDEAFQEWIRGVQQEAANSGISSSIAQSALEHAMLDPRVVELDQKQPETTVTFDQYAQRILNPERIDKARNLYRQHARLLNEIAQRY